MLKWPSLELFLLPLAIQVTYALMISALQYLLHLLIFLSSASGGHGLSGVEAATWLGS